MKTFIKLRISDTTHKWDLILVDPLMIVSITHMVSGGSQINTISNGVFDVIEEPEEILNKIKTNTMIKITQPISDLGLSTRPSTCLKAMGIRTIRHLLSHTEEELLKAKHFGVMCLLEVNKNLRDNGLELGMDLNEIDQI